MTIKGEENIPGLFLVDMTIKEVLRLFQKLGMDIREGRDTIASLFLDGRLIIRTKVPP